MKYWPPFVLFGLLVAGIAFVALTQGHRISSEAYIMKEVGDGD